MKVELLDPELRRGVALFPPVPVHRAWVRHAVRAAMRLRRPGDPINGVTRTTHHNGQGLRVYTPTAGGSGAALLWIHGGGFVIGQAAMDDTFCAVTARDLGITVVSAEYRLAPEHPYPAALDDLLTAWQWLQRTARFLGVDPSRVAVGGQSAGGGLAACLAHCLHDISRIQPIAQWLFCPMLDDRTAARVELDRLRHRVWNNVTNRGAWSAYLGSTPGRPGIPEYAVAARRRDLSGLPPAWIGVGDLDLFAEEDCTYAQRLYDAGVHCTLDVIPAAPHGFEAWAPDTRVARTYLCQARTWLDSRLTTGAHRIG